MEINDKNELKIISHQLEENINHLNLMDVSRLTPAVVCQAISKLNTGKSDPSFCFSLGCFKAAPRKLAEHISNLFKF